MRVLVAQINPTIGDFSGNLKKILSAIERRKDAELVLFCELALCGYPPDDLLLVPGFVATCEEVLQEVITASKGCSVILGTVRHAGKEKPLYNSAAVISDGKLLGFQDKSLLPTYDVFDERRYFQPAEENPIWNLCEEKVAITICEDIWTTPGRFVGAAYPCDPLESFREKGPDLLLNLSASPYSAEKPEARAALVQEKAKALHCPAILCNQVGGNDSLIFDGNSVVVDAEGSLRAQAKAFAEDLLLIDTKNLPPPRKRVLNRTEELYKALVCGLHDYFHKSGFQSAILGLSGGIDSALVAAIAVDALGKENVHTVAMPSQFSSEHSLKDAYKCAENLGISCTTIPIRKIYQSYLDSLSPHFQEKPFDVTEENLQARIRGTLLMALSNKHGHIVLSTGNKSETAMGYATLYGDMVGGLAVINDVTKTQVYELSRWRGNIPTSILEKPPSAELRPDQLDSGTLPDYATLDRVLEDYIEYHLSIETIAERRDLPLELVSDLVTRIHRSEYKRRQAPPGFRVSSKAFSIGRRFPIVQKWQ